MKQEVTVTLMFISMMETECETGKGLFVVKKEKKREGESQL
jgi:hypothetical protein